MKNMMSNKAANLLRENMRRFRTKNLDEIQLDAFKMQPDEYFLDRPEYDDNDTHYEDLLADLKKAMPKKDGRIVIKVAEKLLNYLSVGVYKKLEWSQNKAAEDPSWNAPTSLIQSEIDKIQEVNQDVIKDAIKVLKVSPQNLPAMQTIYDIIYDLYSYVD